MACAPVAQRLRGYESTEYYFVVSKDRQTSSPSTPAPGPIPPVQPPKRCAVTPPDLPALTHVLVTHNHWDQVGGHAYFRSLEPGPEYYARSN